VSHSTVHPPLIQLCQSVTQYSTSTIDTAVSVSHSTVHPPLIQLCQSVTQYSTSTIDTAVSVSHSTVHSPLTQLCQCHTVQYIHHWYSCVGVTQYSTFTHRCNTSTLASQFIHI